MPPFASKPGDYGILYLYSIPYRDASDRASPTFEWRTWAYNADHAIDTFQYADDGWEIVGEATRQRAA